MEQLNQLEQLITTLLNEKEALLAQNAQLQEEVTVTLEKLYEENMALQQQLEEANHVKSTIANRLDLLLDKLKMHNSLFEQSESERIRP